MGFKKDSESAFQQRVIDLGHLLGYKIAHFRPAQTSKGWRTPVAADGKGFPDLILVRPQSKGKPRIVAMELKMPGNKPSEEQEAWIDAWRRAGGEAFVFYPEDWDQIVKVLT